MPIRTKKQTKWNQNRIRLPNAIMFNCEILFGLHKLRTTNETHRCRNVLCGCFNGKFVPFCTTENHSYGRKWTKNKPQTYKVNFPFPSLTNSCMKWTYFLAVQTANFKGRNCIIFILTYILSLGVTQFVCKINNKLIPFDLN